MNWVDIVILVVVVVLGFIGLRQGLVKTVFGLAGIVVGIILAGQWDNILAARIFKGSEWGQIVSFAIILVAILLAANILGSMLKKALAFVMLGWVDKLLGLAFGVAAGVLIMGALIAIIVKAGPLPIPGVGGLRADIKESSLARLIVEQIPLVLALLPAEFSKAKDYFK